MLWGENCQGITLAVFVRPLRIRCVCATNCLSRWATACATRSERSTSSRRQRPGVIYSSARACRRSAGTSQTVLYEGVRVHVFTSGPERRERTLGKFRCSPSFSFTFHVAVQFVFFFLSVVIIGTEELTENKFYLYSACTSLQIANTAKIRH